MPRIPLRRALTLATAVAAAATTLAACTSSSATSSSATSGSATSGSGGYTSGRGVGSIQWSGCSLGGVGASLQCANLQVPLNYADPAGRKITLAVSEVKATAPRSQQLGDLLVNPGG
ncbi:MAG TPA: hypothetical protein VGD68_10710, partial [Streptosporangiaceae bacterium]